MKYVKHAFVILLSSFVFASCSSDGESTIDGGNATDQLVAVSVVTTVEGNYGLRMTRAIDAAWSPEDNIGMYMKKNGQTLGAATIVSNADNVEYITTSGNGIFMPVDINQTIFFPENGDKVDFVAYYPFDDVLVNNYKYAIDVSEQGYQAGIDFMYSNNAMGLDKTSGQANMNFKHQLSKVIFNVVAGEGVTSLSGLTIVIEDMATTGEYDLTTGSLSINNTVKSNISALVGDAGALGEAILLPIGNSSIKATFKLNGNSFTQTLNNVQLNAGVKNTYNVTIKSSGGTVTPTPNYAAWTETPYFEDKAGFQYVTAAFDKVSGKPKPMRNFSLYYDQPNRVALWVAYPLHNSYYGEVDRSNAWGYDPKISNEFQPNLIKSWPSYATKNYNRGHQIASGDRTAVLSANQATFYYSNMTLQKANMNSGIWNKLEEKVRSWGKTDTLFVVTGVMIQTLDEPIIKYEVDNSKKDCAIPQYFYKALMKKIGGQFYTIGYKIPNLDTVAKDSYDKYRINVADIEKETGFKFFLEADDASKQTIVASQWS